MYLARPQKEVGPEPGTSGLESVQGFSFTPQVMGSHGWFLSKGCDQISAGRSTAETPRKTALGSSLPPGRITSPSLTEWKWLPILLPWAQLGSVTQPDPPWTGSHWSRLCDCVSGV